MRTNESLTVVCLQTVIPEGVESDSDWRCIEVLGPLDLSLTGILASLTSPLARAGIPVFAMSSYEADFILVKGAHLSAALKTLEAAGYFVDESQSTSTSDHPIAPRPSLDPSPREDE